MQTFITAVPAPNGNKSQNENKLKGANERGRDMRQRVRGAVPLASHKFLLRTAQVLKSFWVVYEKCELLSILQLLTYISLEKRGAWVLESGQGTKEKLHE